MTAFVSKPITLDNRPCPACQKPIVQNTAEDLSKNVTMALDSTTGEMRWLHNLCAINVYANRTHQRCGRCGEFLTGESTSADGARRQHGINEDGRHCQDGFATTDPRPYIDPYATIAPSAAA